MHTLKHHEQYLEFNPGLDWKLMQVIKHTDDVAVFRNPNLETDYTVLDEL